MLFLGIGVAMLLMKYLEIGPIAGLTWGGDWWIFAIPFALAIAWWNWADASGFTKRKVIEREDKRKADRIDKNREAMGMLPKKKR